ncbi:hypothetical protein LZ198_06310 [Myxococcus sp. K15C18031901]|uniref:hypothetical protein n=1 Tax=Myxococcus dinghuensis TaxID=2906761 RepID=UPI0020A7B44F|nr:hypothetical protein [Myxococcus dinghuensis]MCP3098489.1 hypothetical protein [Myxococcus dinghuensis]
MALRNEHLFELTSLGTHLVRPRVKCFGTEASGTLSLLQTGIWTLVDTYGD